jgi:hypothetical protein
MHLIVVNVNWQIKLSKLLEDKLAQYRSHAPARARRGLVAPIRGRADGANIKVNAPRWIHIALNRLSNCQDPADQHKRFVCPAAGVCARSGCHG